MSWDAVGTLCLIVYTVWLGAAAARLLGPNSRVARFARLAPELRPLAVSASVVEFVYTVRSGGLVNDLLGITAFAFQLLTLWLWKDHDDRWKRRRRKALARISRPAVKKVDR